MAAAAAQYYFRFPVYCCQCVHTVKIYQQTKFCRPISIHSFKSKRPPYWNTTSGFDFYYITVIGMLFCTRLPNFIQIQLLRKYDVISIFQDGGRGCLILLLVSYLLMSLPSKGQSLSANKMSSTYLNSRLKYNYFRFGKQTSVIMTFYFRFRFRPYSRNSHDILYKAAKCHPYRTTQCGNMTSCQFLKMTAATAQYFRFPVCCCHSLQRVKIYQQTEFRLHIAIHGVRHIGILLRVRFWLYHCNRHAILHQAANFIQIGPPIVDIMTSYRFFNMAAAAANTTSGFIFVDVPLFRGSKSISKPNFVYISQFTAEI